MANLILVQGLARDMYKVCSRIVWKLEEPLLYILGDRYKAVRRRNSRQAFPRIGEAGAEVNLRRRCRVFRHRSACTQEFAAKHMATGANAVSIYAGCTRV